MKDWTPPTIEQAINSLSINSIKSDAQSAYIGIVLAELRRLQMVEAEYAAKIMALEEELDVVNSKAIDQIRSGEIRWSIEHYQTNE